MLLFQDTNEEDEDTNFTTNVVYDLDENHTSSMCLIVSDTM